MQRLGTAQFGMIEVDKTWATVTNHIVRLMAGGYCRRDGNPIQDAGEIVDAIPPEKDGLTKERDKALQWFERRDEAGDAPRARPLRFEGYELVYDDSGEPIAEGDLSSIYAFFPDDSPFRRAALEWYSLRYLAHEQERDRARNSLASGELQPAGREREPGSGRFLRKAPGL